MRGLNPIDIPPGGVRYDFTVVKVGRNQEGEPFAHLVIDSGDFARHRISGPVPAGLRVGHRLSAVLHVAWYSRLTQEPVDNDFRDENVVVRYSLSDHARATGPAGSFRARDTTNKFRRT